MQLYMQLHATAQARKLMFWINYNLPIFRSGYTHSLYQVSEKSWVHPQSSNSLNSLDHLRIVFNTTVTTVTGDPSGWNGAAAASSGCTAGQEKTRTRSQTGWWFQTWLHYFPFHIWDVIPTPLTNSIIFQDGYCTTNQQKTGFRKPRCHFVVNLTSWLIYRHWYIEIIKPSVFIYHRGFRYIHLAYWCLFFHLWWSALFHPVDDWGISL